MPFLRLISGIIALFGVWTLYKGQSNTSERNWPTPLKCFDREKMDEKEKIERKKAVRAVSQFYRKELNNMGGDVIAFASDTGKLRFRKALIAGSMGCFFPLIEQFRTQDEPAFCGISTLIMVLNALAIDPARLWKGPWRWYSEEMLDCCKPLEVVEKEGITFEEFSCLARCNGVKIKSTRASESKEGDFREIVKKSVTCCGEAEKAQSNSFIVASYSRKGLGQTGDGHFSPIGGYDNESDSVLVLDVARFKYPPHWVKTTGKTRGWFHMSKSKKKSLILFRLKRLQHPVSQLKAELAIALKKFWCPEGSKTTQEYKKALLDSLHLPKSCSLKISNDCPGISCENPGCSRENPGNSRDSPANPGDCTEITGDPGELQKTVGDLVDTCLRALDSKEGPFLSTVIAPFSREYESRTVPFQKWHIESIPREHLEQIKELTSAIEETKLFKMVNSSMRSRNWCLSRPNSCLHSPDQESKNAYSVTKAHLLTILFMAVVPSLSPELGATLSPLLNLDNAKECLRSEVDSVRDAWDGLCNLQPTCSGHSADSGSCH
ncbi:hypothetical protein AAMO2058_001656300 [Amorphochlora amoebiformis]